MFDIILSQDCVHDFHYYVGIYSPVVLTIVAIVIAYNQYALEKDRESEKKNELFKQKFYEPLQSIWNNWTNEPMDIKHYKNLIDTTIKLVTENKELFDYDDWKLLKTSIESIRKIVKTIVRVSKLKKPSKKLIFFILYKTLFVLLSNIINILLVVGWPPKERRHKHITIYYLILKSFISIYKFLVPYCLQRFIKFRIASIVTLIAIIIAFLKAILPRIYPFLRDIIQVLIKCQFPKKKQMLNNTK